MQAKTNNISNQLDLYKWPTPSQDKELFGSSKLIVSPTKLDNKSFVLYFYMFWIRDYNLLCGLN